MLLFSTLSFHSLSLLIRSSSVSAITTRSSAYSNSHSKVTLNSLDKASMTITNSKGLNAKPWCTHTHTTVLWLCGICPGQPGWAGTRRNIHPLHSSWSSIIPICFLHLLRHMASSVFNPCWTLMHTDLYFKTITVTINCSYYCFCISTHRHADLCRK